MMLSLSLHIGKFCKMPVHDGPHKLSDPYANFLMNIRIREPIVRFHHQKQQQECLRKGYCIVSMMMCQHMTDIHSRKSIQI